MHHWQKLLGCMATTAGFSLLAGVMWFLRLLITSPSKPEGFGQDHQEQWTVTGCWRDLRDARIKNINECSDYAQAHLEFFTDELAPDAATTTCNLSRSLLAYARKTSPHAAELLDRLREEERSDCSHSGTSR